MNKRGTHWLTGVLGRQHDSTPEVTLDQVEEHVAQDRQLVDVRESGEYMSGHIPGARLLPMGQLPARVDELDRGMPLFVVCASGGRSAAMTQYLRNAGFQAYSVAGGTSAWQRSGRPVVTGLRER